MIEVIEAKYVQDYRVWLKFNNGKAGEVDLKEHLWGTIFVPLKEINEFKKFKVSPELGTITWENEADFAPEFLLSHLESSIAY